MTYTKNNRKNRKQYTKNNRFSNQIVSNSNTNINNSTNNASTRLGRMNCSPAVNGRTPLKDTCYTSDILVKIKDAYNQSHSNDQILATLSKDIWSELHNKMQNCEKEDCWLEQIKDPNMRKQIDEIVFAPDQPPEWKSNPDEWLSNFDIAAVLKQYERTYPEFKLLGPSSIDYDTRLPEEGDKCVWDELCHLSLAKLKKKGKTKLGISFNLDKHDDPGSHWVSMFVDLDNALIYYYDSALNPVPSEINRLKEEIQNQGSMLNPPINFQYIKNTKDHQKTNTECGMYSLFFIITFLTGETDFNKNMTIKQKIKLFSNKNIPDKYVQKYRKIYFN